MMLRYSEITQSNEIRSELLLKILKEQHFNPLMVSASHCNGDYTKGFHEYFSSQQKTYEDIPLNGAYKAFRAGLVSKLMKLGHDDSQRMNMIKTLWDSVERYEHALTITSSNFEDCRMIWMEGMLCADCAFTLLNGDPI
jgi:hypothetical protein